MAKKRVVVSFTGGKDCTLTIHELSSNPDFTVGLLVTFAPSEPKFLSHPLRFIKAIANALDIPHRVLSISGPDYHQSYVQRFVELREEGFEGIANGDIEEVCGDFIVS